MCHPPGPACHDPHERPVFAYDRRLCHAFCHREPDAVRRPSWTMAISLLITSWTWSFYVLDGFWAL